MSGYIRRTAKATITPVELNHGEGVEFTLADGSVRRLTLLGTSAAIERGKPGEVEVYSFSCDLDLDGERLHLERLIPDQRSFCEPTEVAGLSIWLDGVSDIFESDGGFMVEKDAAESDIYCCPRRTARLALQDASLRLCPEPVGLWYPNPDLTVDVRECYRGEDTWMGPYEGRLAHGGLDVNMPAGTPLYAPIDFDDQFLFHCLATGQRNNRWRGIRRWPDGSTWCLQAHHVIELLVPEHTPLERGTHYAVAAGVHVGVREHSHFVWSMFDHGEPYFLDPWLIFWQAFRDTRAEAANG